VCPLNGNVPVKITKRTTPRAQISADGPLYYCFVTISGAIKLGVPQNILTLVKIQIPFYY
jgi:hypothetical protein